VDAPPPSERRPIDLHVHTTASDGDLSPSKCVEEAERQGLAAIAITDHDTTAGNAEAEARGFELGLEVVPGVEVSARHEGLTVHLLGYYPEPGVPEFEALLAGLQANRDERNPRILERLAALGRPVDPEEVAAAAGGTIIGRPHIAAVLIRKGYVRTFQEAFDRYLGKGAAAYIQRTQPEPREAIHALRCARAVPVFAHPGTLGAEAAMGLDALVAQLVEWGLRGIEAYYHSHSSDQTAAFLRLADRHGIVATGGTDFHGAQKPGIRMGAGAGNLHVPYERLVRLREERERL